MPLAFDLFNLVLAPCEPSLVTVNSALQQDMQCKARIYTVSASGQRSVLDLATFSRTSVLATQILCSPRRSR